MRRMIFILFSLNKQRCAASFFVFVFFPPVQQTTSGIDHRVKCTGMFFFGLATNTLNVSDKQEYHVLALFL